MQKKQKFYELIKNHVQTDKNEENENKEEKSHGFEEIQKLDETHKLDIFKFLTLHFFSKGKLMTLEDREMGNVSFTVWKEYIHSAGG